MVHHSQCLICSSKETSVMFNCTDHFLSGQVFPLVKCRKCGFIFTQDHPDEKEAGKYYQSDQYISHSDTSAGLVNTLYRLARQFMLARKTRLVKKITGLDHGKLLDIGSGTGYFASAMKRNGWNAEGIEINEGAREFAEKKFGLIIYEPSEIRSLQGGTYDCITLWHVLEHFTDPDSYMNEIRRLLKPGGKCIVALPNCSSSDADYYKDFWAAWDVPRHLWHFTPSTFKKYCDKSTFTLININSLPLDAVYISILSEKYMMSRVPFLAGVIKGKWFWFKSMFNKIRASSLIYIIE